MSRCTSHPERCTAPATHWLTGPDGLRVPGALFCQAHAEECIREYARAWGECWSVVEIEGQRGTPCTGVRSVPQEPAQGSLFGDAA